MTIAELLSVSLQVLRGVAYHRYIMGKKGKKSKSSKKQHAIKYTKETDPILLADAKLTNRLMMVFYFNRILHSQIVLSAPSLYRCAATCEYNVSFLRRYHSYSNSIFVHQHSTLSCSPYIIHVNMQWMYKYNIRMKHIRCIVSINRAVEHQFVKVVSWRFQGQREIVRRV